MAITALPTPPSRQDPENFASDADAFLGAVPTFATEANALQADVNAKQVTASNAAIEATNQAALAADQVALSHADALATAADRVQTGLDRVQTGLDVVAAETSRVQASKLNLGAYATAPTLDNQGEPLLTGATYYDTTLDKWRVYDGSAWTDGLSAVAGVSSFNGATGAITGVNSFNGATGAVTGVSSFNGSTGHITYEVPQVLAPAITSPANLAIDQGYNTGIVNVSVLNALSIYGTEVQQKIQLSTSSDFTSILYDSGWGVITGTSTAYKITQADGLEISTIYYLRAVGKTTTVGEEYQSQYSTIQFTTSNDFFDEGLDIDSLSQITSIQQEYNPATTYAAGAIVIVRKSDLRLLEYKSLISSNVGNSPETSPAAWELVIDDNISTAGYFGEILGSACVVDKGEWNSTTSYVTGNMVVVKTGAGFTQADLTAYVALSANSNTDPTTNPAVWQQRNGLPTGTSLAQTLGIGNTTPEVLVNNDSGWLKFVHKGKIKYIAKKPFMHTVSWNDIAKAEAVYGNRTVRIGSRLFRVSLLSGAEADPSSWVTTSTATDNKGAGSEWNELIYRVHTGVPTDGVTTYHGGKQLGSNWYNFANADVVIGVGDGRYAWCKETPSYNTSNRVIRGYDSLSDFAYVTSSNVNTGYGWRPCLTLISDAEVGSNLYLAEASGVGPSAASLQYDPITDTGFYGEVTAAQFYSGTQISTACGITAGTLQFDTDPWLKFYWHGMVLYISKKPYRYNLSWDTINTANAVYGVNLGSTGRLRITHSASGNQLDVKLMKGATKDPSPASSPGRQWDELLYRVADEDPTTQIGGDWAAYSYADLQITGNGSYCWMQEVYQPSTSHRVVRGYGSLSGFNSNTSSGVGTAYGWRPCLSLVK